MENSATSVKLFQRLGYFPKLNDIPSQITQYIGMVAGFQNVQPHLDSYATMPIRWRHMAQIREHLKVKALKDGGKTVMRISMEQAAMSKDIIADIINAGIEEMVRERYELPAFSAFLRTAHKARSTVNKAIYRNIYNQLGNDYQNTLRWILSRQDNENQSPWNRLKQEPKQPTIKHMREFIAHLIWLQEMNQGIDIIDSIPEAKLKRFAEQAKSLDIGHMNKFDEQKRLTLAVSLIRVQTAQVLDDLTQMFVRRVQKLRTKGRTSLEEYQLHHQETADALIETLGRIAETWGSTQDGKDRLEGLEKILGGNAEEILKQCQEHLAHSKNNYIPFLPRFYKPQRPNFFRFLELLQPRSTSTDKTLEEGITFLLRNKDARAVEISVVRDTKTDTDKTETIPLLDLSWVPDKWWKFVTNTSQRGAIIKSVNRIYFEICLFSCVMQELKSGDLCIANSDKFNDSLEQMISWEEYDDEVATFCQQFGYSPDPDTFINQLKAWLESAINLTDRGFPTNESVHMKNGEPVIRKIRKQPIPAGFVTLDRLLVERLPEINILEVLLDTEYWLKWTSTFGTISGFEDRLDNPQQRYITTTFCYGCNLGPTQTARSIEGLDRRQVSYVNQKHINEEKLLSASVHIINEYNKFVLPKFWGSGTRASADGTKWDVYEQNLLSEYHIRYGGWGGIGYYHVSDTYIALFSHFISCGVWEAVHILDGLLENQSEIRPDTIHADTQGQSETVFGLAYLLGIKLMPRIRNWKDLKWYLPSADFQVKHIQELFSDNIDWELIRTHLPDMIRIAISISKGKIRSSTILRKLSSYSRKNKLYFAFRELGRVVRTVFLLNYIADEELRRMINAATNTSEAWNGFIQWVAFGGHGVISENNREEQRKMIRYNHLVANLVVFHNMVSMTSVLQALLDSGHEITPEILGCLSPYRTSHINRFGNYQLLERVPQPMVKDLRL